MVHFWLIVAGGPRGAGGKGVIEPWLRSQGPCPQWAPALHADPKTQKNLEYKYATAQTLTGVARVGVPPDDDAERMRDMNGGRRMPICQSTVKAFGFAWIAQYHCPDRSQIPPRKTPGARRRSTVHPKEP
ncbi:MAG: hypothetical protein CME06_07210 [Gemmatimonadetes bacterium]|nr:hypothetical protein [Gemmatimonadota bacterium]